MNVDSGEASNAEDDVDEDALARLAESFHSERGTHKKVTWSPSQERRSRGASLGRAHSRTMISPITRLNSQASLLVSPVLPSHEPDYVNRGRPVSRPLDESGLEWTTESSAQRRSSRASRKGAGMVFLSVWALFSVGALVDSQNGRREAGVGRVLVRNLDGLVNVPSSVGVSTESLPLNGQLREGNGEELSFRDLQFSGDVPPSDPSTEYIIGRISAWVCTTLYLTSRLPQIWKNVRTVPDYNCSMNTDRAFIDSMLGNPSMCVY